MKFHVTMEESELEAWLTRVDDEGFVCGRDGARIVDENHPLLALCQNERWQCFVVSRDPYNDSVRGLRRTCEEENDNSNKAWSRTRRRVTGVPAEKAWGKTVVECVEMLRSSIFHVWDCLLYTSPSPRDKRQSRMPSSA